MKIVAVLKVIFLVLCAFLVACGADGSKRQGDGEGGNTANIHVFGKVIDGHAESVLVRLFDAETHEALAEVKTGVDGRYSFTLQPSFYGRSVIAEAIFQEGSKFDCNLVQGCLEAELGNSVTVSAGEGFSLFAIKSSMGRESPININLFTTVAYRKVRTLSGALLVDEFLDANASTALLLGLAGRLEAIEAYDLNREPLFEGASYNSVRASLLEVALLNAVAEKSSPNTAYSEVVERSVQSVSGLDSAGLPVTPVVYLDEVYRAAIDYTVTRDLTGIDVARAKSLISTELEYSDLVLHDAPWAPSVAPVLGVSPISEVKGFIREIRQIAGRVDFASLLSLSNLDNLVSGDILKVTEIFGLSVNDQESQLNALPDYLAVLGRIAVACFYAIAEHYTTGEIPARIDGIDIDVSVAERVYTFHIGQYFDVCDGEQSDCSVFADLDVVLDIASFGGNSLQDVLSVGGRANVAGIMTLGDGTLTLDSQSLIEFPFLELNFGFSDDASVSISSLEGVGVGLNVGLPVQFSSVAPDTSLIVGSANLVADLINFSYANNVFGPAVSGVENSFFEETSIELSELLNANITLALSENWAANSPNSFVLNVVQAGGRFDTGVKFINRNTYDCAEADFFSPSCSFIGSTVAFEGETNENFLPLAVTLYGTADIYGEDVEAFLAISGERKSPTENAINSLRVSSAGYLSSLVGEFNSGGGINSLQGTNLNGSKINIFTEGGDRKGIASDFNDIEVVDILDMGEWLKFKYSDGSFDSL